MTHLFPTAQLKNRCVEAQGHTFVYIIFYLYVLLNQIRDNHIFTIYKGLTMIEKKKKGGGGKKKRKKKKKKKTFFFFLGHKIYRVGSFLSGRSGYRKQ